MLGYRWELTECREGSEERHDLNEVEYIFLWIEKGMTAGIDLLLSYIAWR